MTFTARDDRFHFAALGDDWWATETAWFSFHHPERKLGGWFYTLVRPNIGTIAGGAWVWDHTAHLPWDVLYCANYSSLAIPRDQDLDDCRLPTGVAIKVLDHGRRYALGFADGDRLSAALTFDAVMPPHPLTAVGSTFGNAHHFDQLGRVHGEITLHGERVPIDCIAMRDRTWGRRPEDRPRQAAYVTGATDAANGFLAVTNVRGGPERSSRSDGVTGEEIVAFGFLHRDGRTENLTAGAREVVRNREHGWIERIRLTATDAAGRKLEADGEPVSRIFVNRHTFIDVNSLVRWKVDGAVAWGEDQDMWPVHRWAALRRAAR
jgi:hypothetical protein